MLPMLPVVVPVADAACCVDVHAADAACCGVNC